MTDDILPRSQEEQEDTFLKNLHRLFFRPKVYFEGIRSPKKKGWLFLFALSFAVATAIDGQSVSVREPTAVLKTWLVHWGSILVAGLIGMVVAYFIGEAWYRFRLGCCGARQEDRTLVRLVYLSSAQVVAIPMIVMELVATFRFPDPAAAAAGRSIWTPLIAVFFIVLSYRTSTVGVRTVFKVSKSRSALWFFILPVLFLFLLIAVGFLAGLGMSSSLGLEAGGVFSGPKAETSNPLEFSRFDLAFSYPGNWTVTESGQPPGVGAKVEIQGEGGVYFLIQETAATDGAELVADTWVNSIVTEPTRVQAFDSWGSFKGAGRRFGVRSGAAPSEIRLFVAPLAEGRVLMIYETFPAAGRNKVERGFKLIRKTFRMTQ